MLKVDQNNWCPMAEQAITLIYRLAEHPDVICADVIKKQAAALLPPKPETEGLNNYCSHPLFRDTGHHFMPGLTLKTHWVESRRRFLES